MISLSYSVFLVPGPSLSRVSSPTHESAICLANIQKWNKHIRSRWGLRILQVWPLSSAPAAVRDQLSFAWASERTHTEQLPLRMWASRIDTWQKLPWSSEDPRSTCIYRTIHHEFFKSLSLEMVVTRQLLTDTSLTGIIIFSPNIQTHLLHVLLTERDPEDSCHPWHEIIRNKKSHMSYSSDSQPS